MSVTIFRPGKRIYTYGDMGTIDIRQQRSAAAAANWWDLLPNVWAAYQPKGAASLAASYLDLSGNGNNAGVGVAPTWDGTNGWIFNGSTQYLTTTFTPAADQSQTIIVQFTNGTGAATRVIVGSLGSTGGGGPYFLLETNYGGSSCFYGNGAFVAVVPVLAAGNLGVAGNRGYRNGVAEGAAITAAAGTYWPVYIGAANGGGTACYFWPGNIQALALCDATESADDILAAVTAMAAL